MVAVAAMESVAMPAARAMESSPVALEGLWRAASRKDPVVLADTTLPDRKSVV